MINFEDLFKDLFSDQEKNIFQHLAGDVPNIEELKKTGNVEQIVEEIDGIVTNTVTYTSFDGSHTYCKVYTYRKVDEFADSIRSINEKIEKAVSEEDYELAAELKKEKIALLQASKQKEGDE